jgi:hypothetical protein
MIDLSTLPPEEQFDFWLGQWDVSWGEDQHGSNHVTRILGSRVIQENFNGAPAIDFQGMSVSVYSPRLEQWRQTWVDNNGNYWDFTGGVQGSEMILATDDVVEGQPVKLRMVFYNIAQDELDWRWERSDDDGRTWQEQWRLHYSRIVTSR